MTDHEILRIQAHLHALDLNQTKIGKTIAPSAQSIHGIVGNGKALQMMQRAAHMHLEHLKWDIALVLHIY